MKKKACLVLCALVLLACASGFKKYVAPTTSAKAACTVEVETGRVLYGKNENTRLPMASTTKIMTALVIIERGELDKVVTIPRAAQGVEGSSIYLKAGEQFSRRDLLYGLMLRSGNDAAEALATDAAGSVAEFVKLMNEKAQALGMTNSAFQNPHGLPNDAHYTTARDLAVLSAASMRNETFCEIVGTKSVTITPKTEGTARNLANKNKLLWSMEGGAGIKTGYTKAAGRCLVGACIVDGKQVVNVVLNDPNMWTDVPLLMTDALNSHTIVEMVGQGVNAGSIAVQNGVSEYVEVVTQAPLSVCVTAEEQKRLVVQTNLLPTLHAPVEIGEAAGEMVVMLDGVVLSSTQLICTEQVIEKTIERDFWHLIHLWITQAA